MVENLRSDEKNAATGKKSVKKKPPERGYAHWSQDTFDKLVGGEPEQLRSHFQVNHQMVMSLLDRPVMATVDGGTVDGCGAVRRLMVDNHETRKRQRGHIRGRSPSTGRSSRPTCSSSPTRPTSTAGACG